MSEPLLPQSTSAKVLLVDDDLQLVRGLKTALEHYGYVVRACERGTNAPETAIQFRPDLIVLDQRLGAAFAERCVHVARISPQRAIGLGDRSRHVKHSVLSV